ncbi:MAG: sigma-E factor negative regulatory protein [Sideroxydans sp.]|nr:sigma-E factor negative regulatory protein [Sideroxydans sp.]
MKNKISALMDGELFADEANHVIAELKSQSSAQQDWQIYHLIGDVLRQPEAITREVGSAVHERLQLEAVILAPQRSMTEKARNIALSAAASVMAVVAVSWMAMQATPNKSAQLAAQTSALTRASFVLKPQVNAYLLAHQELSPSSDVQGGSAFIRTTNYSNEDVAP